MAVLAAGGGRCPHPARSCWSASRRRSGSGTKVSSDATGCSTSSIGSSEGCGFSSYLQQQCMCYIMCVDITLLAQVRHSRGCHCRALWCRAHLSSCWLAGSSTTQPAVAPSAAQSAHTSYACPYPVPLTCNALSCCMMPMMLYEMWYVVLPNCTALQ